MGSHDHHDAAHAPAGPYSPKHHAPYPEEARLFGIQPGDKRQGFELITVFVYLTCATILCIAGCSRNDSTDFKV